ncbi:MAG: hypothetical protein IRZ16_09590 [Myxococcaceae bacterium]|nr:hypothetical protein [Myxococcaceae bacterium]
MRCLCAALLLLLATACGDELPPPQIRSITPAETEHGSAPLVRLEVDAIFPFSVDYGAEATSVDSEVIVRIGGFPIAATALLPDGAITGQVPYSLPPGAYDVALELGDGRSALLPHGFTVKPGAFPESFSFDPIADQRRNRPFTITLHAVGGQAAQFKGVVQLDSSRGRIAPEQSDPFVAGELTQMVTIFDGPGDVTITARDAEGHEGTSNTFRLTN